MEDSACSTTVGPKLRRLLDPSGHHIEFIETLPLTIVPSFQPPLSPDPRAVLSAEIADLKRKEAIHYLSPNNIDLEFYSNVFAVPKKGEGGDQLLT